MSIGKTDTYQILKDLHALCEDDEIEPACDSAHCDRFCVSQSFSFDRPPFDPRGKGTAGRSAAGRAGGATSDNYAALRSGVITK